MQVPAEIKALKAEVEEYAKAFPTIGFEKATMRYKE
jgi:glycine hydroxymethyltransferase